MPVLTWLLGTLVLVGDTQVLARSGVPLSQVRTTPRKDQRPRKEHGTGVPPGFGQTHTCETVPFQSFRCGRQLVGIQKHVAQVIACIRSFNNQKTLTTNTEAHGTNNANDIEKSSI